MTSVDVIELVAGNAGLGLFAWVVYQKLADVTRTLQDISESLIRMEERGGRIVIHKTDAQQSKQRMVAVQENG